MSAYFACREMYAQSCCSHMSVYVAYMGMYMFYVCLCIHVFVSVYVYMCHRVGISVYVSACCGRCVYVYKSMCILFMVICTYIQKLHTARLCVYICMYIYIYVGLCIYVRVHVSVRYGHVVYFRECLHVCSDARMHTRVCRPVSFASICYASCMYLCIFVQ